MVATTPFADGISFPEAPRWHLGQLWFSDIFGQRVMRATPEGALTVVAELDDRPSGLGFLPGGDLLVVAMRTKQLWRVGAAGDAAPYADLSAYADNWINDMAVDHLGRAWVGAIDLDHAGRQVLVRPDGTTAIAHGDIHSPNGPALTADGRLVVAATRSEAIFAFHIADDGRLVDKHVYASVPGVMPDGLCLDAEGAVWTSNLEASEFIRVLPGGRVTHRIALRETRWALACVLGGTRLYMCSARGPNQGLPEGVYEGYLDIADVAIPGPE